MCLTDGAALARGGWAFCAAAEDISYRCADGRCLESIVGVVDRADNVVAKQRLALACKTEGIAVIEEGASLEPLLVTDADDRSTPGLLLSVTLVPGAEATS